MMPAIIPTPAAGDVRRRVPKVSKNQRVPLWTVEPEGQEIEGVIRVPVSLLMKVLGGYTNPPEHTNLHHRFDKLIGENLARWAHWRAKRGWFIDASTLRVDGPSDPPEGDRLKDKARLAHATKRIGKAREVGAITEFDYAEEYQWYVATARFTREEPVYVRLEDMLFLRHLALTYGIDPDRDPPPYNYLPEGKDVIDVEGGLDPMQVAEERRQSMGLKRSDYLMGKLWEPL